MSTPHKATPDQWSDAGAFASDTRAWLLALRARVEALEEAKSIIDKPAPAPASSLVERVANAIVAKATSAGIVDDRPARAAIREVAAWFATITPRGSEAWRMASEILRQEANR